jgi:hypothetical protein
MNHKRGRPKNRRAGCKLCKPWKGNGMRKLSYLTCQEQQARVVERDQKEE